MSKTTYIGYIKNKECDVNTLVVAENETDALKQVLEKFKTSLNYAEEDISIVKFADVHGGVGK